MFNLFKSARAIGVSPQEAHELERQGKICLVDVREADEWAQMRVPGALHAPLSSLAVRLSSLPQDRASGVLLPIGPSLGARRRTLQIPRKIPRYARRWGDYCVALCWASRRKMRDQLGQ